MLPLPQSISCRHSSQYTLVLSTCVLGSTVITGSASGLCYPATIRLRRLWHFSKQDTAGLCPRKGSIHSLVMPRQKRKASVPGPIDSQQSSSNPDSPATPLQALRRSGRNSAAFLNVRSHEKASGYKDKAGDAENRTERSSVSEEKARDGEPTESEGVDAAIHALAKMERRFKRAVKKQKLKLEESAISVDSDDVQKQIFKPESTHISTGALAVSAGERAESIDKQQAAKNDHIKKEEPMSNEGEDAMDIEETLDAPERGPSRAPPVNSDYLPLPWKGRLGYVSQRACP